jgi:hypothetical protein
MRHVLDGAEIGWRVIGADAAFILTEDHVHDPMQAVFDEPMTTHDWPHESRQHDQGGEI